MSRDAELFERAADGLCEVTLAMEDVDLNALVDEDARAFLEHKEALHEMTKRYRRDQHALESRRAAQRGESGDSAQRPTQREAER